MNKTKKRIRWGNFFTYLIVSFPLFLVVIWFASITMPFDIPVMITTAVIAALTSLFCAYQTDEEYQAEEDYYKTAAKYSNTNDKPASVTKRAVVGTIIGGVPGAIIGAASAIDKNNKQNK